jgi:hypothetical protein
MNAEMVVEWSQQLVDPDGVLSAQQASPPEDLISSDSGVHGEAEHC